MPSALNIVTGDMHRICTQSMKVQILKCFQKEIHPKVVDKKNTLIDLKSDWPWLEDCLYDFSSVLL